MTTHKPMTPADHIARAKSEALNGDAKYAMAHALIAIAEQGQPVEIVLTDDQLNRAAESLSEQTGILSLARCGNIVARMISEINEASR